LLLSEVETALTQAFEQHESYLRIKATSSAQAYGSDELQWAEDELKATLSTLEADVEELQDSINAVERSGAMARFGLTAEELKRRKDFVRKTNTSIQVCSLQLCFKTYGS